MVLADAETFASRLFRSIVIVSLSKHLLSSHVFWCSAFCHTTAACVSGKVPYAIPVPLLFVARCTHQAVRQGHPQPVGGAKSGWRRNARALRDDGKTKQNALAVRTLKLRLVSLGPKTDDLLMLLQMLHGCRARPFSSLPSLLATIFSLLPSPMSLRTLHQNFDSASNPLHPVPHHPWPGGMREAIK